MKEIMEVREFIERDVDVDVVDDVCESLYIGFVGPQGLTEAGKHHFENALDLKIELDEEESTAVVLIDGPGWKAKLRAAKEFFVSAAGYCTESDYNHWFTNEFDD